MVNKIWGFLIVCGILFSLSSGKIEVVNTTILSSTKTSLEMIMQLFPVMALWLGIMNIATKAGILKWIAKLLSPVLSTIFKSVPKNHESLSYITSNIIASTFGLGNAATPFGLKAMKSLQELNQDKTTASDAMITFLVINTSGLTLIPTTVISLRMLTGSKSPSDITIYCIIVSVISTCLGLLFDYLFRRFYERHHI